MMVRGGVNLNRLYALFLIFSTMSAFVVEAKELPKKETAQSSFRVLEQELTRFKNDAQARKYRHRYEVLIDHCKKYKKKWPKSNQAGQALMAAAQLSEDIAKITRLPEDVTAAVHAYLVVVQEYPKEAVANKALLRAVYLKKNTLNDPKGAQRLLKQFGSKEDVIEKQQSTAFVSPSQEVIRKISIREFEQKLQISVVGLKKSNWIRGEIEKSADAPRRIFFDVSPAKLSQQIPPFFDVNKEKIYKVRIGQQKADVVRLVFDIGDDVDIIISPKEGEIVLEPSSKINVPKTEVALIKKDKTEIVRKEAVFRPKVIVLDPGHGGDDPGAIGYRGLKEKQVTLEIAKRVKRVIEDEIPNVKVYMTRQHDQTVSLSKRTEIANSLEADLFISIHANAAPNSHAQGIETYYLNITHDRYAIRLAARENAMSETEISNLEFILADLAMKSNVSDSIRLGQVVQSSMYTRVKERWDDAKDLGLKHALFYVLLGVRMPAILIETSFISNKEEEKRLKSDSYQHALAEGVVKGVKRYMEEQQAMYVP